MNTVAVDELHIGFTGTREGMTTLQHMRVYESLKRKVQQNPTTTLVFHHGDCIGADEEAHEIATGLGYLTVAHPPLNPYLRAFCAADTILEPKEYLVRNRDIVNDSHLVIGTPSTMEYVARSGTWSTIAYARNNDKLWKIIKPKYYRPITD